VCASLTSDRAMRLALAAAVAAGALLLPPHLAGAQDYASSGEAPQAGMTFFSFAPAKALQAAGMNVSAAWTSDMSKAQEAYRKGDFVAARESLERASGQGDIIATWYLGHIYRLGRGVPADSAKAFSYYLKVVEAFSADESNPQRLRVMVDALVRVADTYRTGNEAAGITANPREAFGMFNTAASFGHPAAHYALARMLIEGNGVRRNPEMGVKWLMLAARKRFVPAQAALGDLYWQGGILRQDRVRALMWYKLAEESTEPGAYPEIADRLLMLESQATDSERADALARAKSWADKYPAAVVSVGMAE
jgi:uncharacterized protein